MGDAPPIFTLQSILTPKPGRPAALYAEDGLLPAIESGTTFHLRAGDHVSGNSYFNSFYLAPWRDHARVGRLGLHVHLTGTARLRVIGVDGDGASHVLMDQISDAPDGDELILWLDAFGAEALAGRSDLKRLYFDIAATDDTRVDHLAYVTDMAPLQVVRLSLGLCTYGREAHLKETLRGVARARAVLAEICAVYVVNQGATFQDPELPALIDDLGGVLIEQANLGGCGGFNRTMYEAAIADDTATYHLLMDDDIELDPRVIERAVAFARYLTKPIMLGGQMLIMQKPTLQYEAGGKIDGDWSTVPFGRHLDLADPAALALFDELPDLHYNAWWCCMIPTAAIRDCGLSAPMFIRGDDVEYGCRLKTHGVETVPLPGLGVWHDAFEHKHADWLFYYDVRNRLINGALYPQYASKRDVLYVLGFNFNFILMHRYAVARILRMAVLNYLSGPERAFAPDAETRHAHLMRRIAQLPKPEILDSIDPADYDDATARLIDYHIWDTVKRFVGTFFRITFLSGSRLRPLLFDVVPSHPSLIGPHAYAMPEDPSRKRYVVFKPSRAALWADMVRAFWMTLVYIVRRKSAARRWRAAFADVTDVEAWKASFDLPRDRDFD